MSEFPGGEAGAGPTHQAGGAGPSASSRRVLLAGGLALAALVGGALWSMLAVRLAPLFPPHGRVVKLLTMERPFPAGGRYPGDPFIGPAACRDCHPAETALHWRSGHAHTLSSTARRKLARQVDHMIVADPERPDVSWEYRFADGRLYVGRRTSSWFEELVAEYAFGSGQHAVTFVNVVGEEPPKIFEHRMTYYANTRSFRLSPGHDTVPKLPGMTPLGGFPQQADAWSCFACHSTQVSTEPGLRIDEERLIPNISCERCHGPARAHVEAAARNAPPDELKIPFGPRRGYTAEQVIGLCGMCHRHPGKPGVGPLDPENSHLARFQPVGVLQSRCYRESGGGFSCVTCHDPHDRTSRDRPAYNAKCVSCHHDASVNRAAAPTLTLALAGDRPASARGLPCPVEPAGDCVACHMPRVDAGQGVLFADHWIRVRRRPDPSASAAGSAGHQ